METAPATGDALRIGVAANMPPFVYREDGQLVGLEVDFGKELAKDMGKSPLFIDMEFEELIPALRSGKVDIVMAGLNFTPERAAIISMTTPYLRSGQMALVLRKNASKYALPGLIGNTKDKVGAEAGTTGEYLVEASFPNAQLVSYDSAIEGAKAVANGEVQLLIHDAPTIYWLAGTYANSGVTPARPVLTEDLMVWAIGRGNSELLDEVNGIITDWAADGTLNKIAGRWISF
ncbi:MAG: substrate-binding periplasmic protein [Puniceicoccales bacterium]